VINYRNGPFNLLLWFLIAFISVYSNKSVAQVVQFENVSIKDGLSQATVTCMMQDSEGYIWLGTRDGLNRYDGVGFAVLKNNPADSTTLSSSSITALYEDKSGYIWVGTSFGLNRLNSKTFVNERHYHWLDNDEALSNNKITAITGDTKGNIWVGTENGLNRIVDESGKFERFSIQKSDSSSLSNNHITALFASADGTLCVGTMGGFNLLNTDGKTFRRYGLAFFGVPGLSHIEVTSIASSRDGHIWIGTRNGLNRFDPYEGTFDFYFKDQPRRDFLPSSIIRALMCSPAGIMYVGTPLGLTAIDAYTGELMAGVYMSAGMPAFSRLNVRSLLMDKSGLVWVGTQAVGASSINLDAPQFLSVYYSGSEEEDIDRNQIFAFTQVDTNCIFLGTARGINRYDTGNRSAVAVFDDPKHPLYDMRSEVKALLLQDKTLWMGTNGEGLIGYDMESQSVNHYRVNPANNSSISSNRVTTLLSHREGTFWIGTFGGGLCYFDSRTGNFRTYKFDLTTGGLKENNITCLSFDSDSALWIGTGQSGLYRMDIASGNFEHFQAGNPNKGLLKSGNINDLHLDEGGRLWVAMAGGGMALWRPEVELFQSYTEADGLANDAVLAITSDISGNIWISTNIGISSFNYSTQTFRNYFDDEVLSHNTFNIRSCYRDRSNRIYFGGANGFDYFYSGRLSENSFIPNIVITGCQLLNDNSSQDRLELARYVSDTLVLNHDHPGFTIDFAALNFRQPGKNQYAYRLIGLFDNWRYIGNRRFATFANLLPGTYIFEVIGSNNDGLWNYRPARVYIIVKPSFWQRWESKLLIIVAIVITFYLLYGIRIRGERRRRLALQRAVADRTKEIARERDINEVLLREVHHRVKNNLQIIVSLLNLQSRFIKDNTLLGVFSEIQNRVRSMSLIHQKMYQSKDLSTLNIVGYITDLSNSLISTYSLTGKIKLDIQVNLTRFKSDTLTPLGLIINEVISNSLKYAFRDDQEGTILVRLNRMPSGKLQMLIGDDGVGLPADFDFQSTDSFGTELIAALTEQLNGTIIVRRDMPGTVYQIDFEEIEG
jgi:two-component sensor histidine kinase/ligand-binding sensor domain-containing protein